MGSSEYEPWPDFTGPMPDGWKLREWEAAKAINAGATQEQAGALETVARSRKTVTDWVARWRRIYGPDFLPAKEGLTDENRGSHLGGEATRAKWAAVRNERAAEMGSLASLAADVAAVGLEQLLTDGRAKELDALDLERITRIADRLARLADKLDGAALPGIGGPEETGVPEGLLAGLETKPGAHADVLERLDIVHASYTKIRQAEAAGPEPIDL